MHDTRHLPASNCFIHAPCALGDVVEEGDAISFVVEGWGARAEPRPYYVLVSGWTAARYDVTARPRAEESALGSTFAPVPALFVPGSRLLIISLNGPATVHIRRRVP